MDDRCVEREQNQAGAEAIACIERGLDTVLGFGCRQFAMGRGKCPASKHAIAKKRRRFTIVFRGRVFSLGVFQRIENGQLDCIGNEGGMQTGGASA